MVITSMKASMGVSFRESCRGGRWASMEDGSFHGSKTYTSVEIASTKSFRGSFRGRFHVSCGRFHVSCRSLHGGCRSFNGSGFHGGFHYFHGRFHGSFRGINFHESFRESFRGGFRVFFPVQASISSMKVFTESSTEALMNFYAKNK